jgi:hypothetical protein
VEREDDEPSDDHSGGVAEVRQLVGDEHEPRRELAGPLVFVLAVHSDRVLAGDGEQTFNHRSRAAPVQTGVGDDGERLAE